MRFMTSFRKSKFIENILFKVVYFFYKPQITSSQQEKGWG